MSTRSENEISYQGVLNHLANVCDTSEEGFRVVAQTVKNRGLKLLLKAYAQQRATFAANLRRTIAAKLNGRSQARGIFLGQVHRGWITIKAALTIGQEATEDVILEEAIRGERYALRQYRQALAAPLTASLRSQIQRQKVAIQAAHEDLKALRGQNGKRLVVRLFDNQELLEQAAAALGESGILDRQIRVLAVHETLTGYPQDTARKTVRETAVTGALGGAAISTVLAIAAGLSLAFVPGLGTFVAGSIAATVAFILLGGVLIGGLFGSIFGFLIGMGVSEEDSYLYQKSLADDRLLMLVETEQEKASQTNRIMQQVNLARAA